MIEVTPTTPLPAFTDPLDGNTDMWDSPQLQYLDGNWRVLGTPTTRAYEFNKQAPFADAPLVKRWVKAGCYRYNLFTGEYQDVTLYLDGNKALIEKTEASLGLVPMPIAEFDDHVISGDGWAYVLIDKPMVQGEGRVLDNLYWAKPHLVRTITTKWGVLQGDLPETKSVNDLALWVEQPLVVVKGEAKLYWCEEALIWKLWTPKKTYLGIDPPQPPYSDKQMYSLSTYSYYSDPVVGSDYFIIADRRYKFYEPTPYLSRGPTVYMHSDYNLCVNLGRHQPTGQSAEEVVYIGGVYAGGFWGNAAEALVCYYCSYTFDIKTLKTATPNGIAFTKTASKYTDDRQGSFLAQGVYFKVKNLVSYNSDAYCHTNVNLENFSLPGEYYYMPSAKNVAITNPKLTRWPAQCFSFGTCTQQPVIWKNVNQLDTTKIPYNSAVWLYPNDFLYDRGINFKYSNTAYTYNTPLVKSGRRYYTDGLPHTSNVFKGEEKNGLIILAYPPGQNDNAVTSKLSGYPIPASRSNPRVFDMFNTVIYFTTEQIIRFAIPEQGPYYSTYLYAPPSGTIPSKDYIFLENHTEQVLRGPYEGYWCRFDYISDGVYKVTKLHKLREDEATQDIFPTKIENQFKRS